jgi:glycolate oxidase
MKGGQKMLEALKSNVVGELEKIVGSDYVSTNQADLYVYSYDLTPAETRWPDVVVLPKSLEEVRTVIKLADNEKIPVIPYVAGGNVGGLTIPLEGGIMLDLKRMNRIIEVCRR